MDGLNEKLSLGDWAQDREEFDWTDHPILARLWIDQDLKREMGF